MILWLYERRSRLVARIESLKSPGISDMPKGGDHRSKEDLIAEKVDIERRIQKHIDKGTRYKSEITDMIDTLDDRHEAEVLERYFIYCETFGMIAAKMGYTERHVIRLYTAAVTKIAQSEH